MSKIIQREDNDNSVCFVCRLHFVQETEKEDLKDLEEYKIAESLLGSVELE